MEKCVKLLVNEAGEITKTLGEISCKTTVYPYWFIYLTLGGIILALILVGWSLVSKRKVRAEESPQEPQK